VKTLVFILLFLSFMITPCHSVPVISDDFYLSRGDIFDSNSVTASNILPNTLRLTLIRGESTEIRADVLPENTTEHELTWTLPDKNGTVEIYPHGNHCTVVGVKLGEEILRIAAHGGANRDVSVSVKEPEKIQTRSFEYSGSPKDTKKLTTTTIQTAVRILITLGAAAVLFSLFIAISHSRRWKK